MTITFWGFVVNGQGHGMLKWPWKTLVLLSFPTKFHQIFTVSSDGRFQVTMKKWGLRSEFTEHQLLFLITCDQIHVILVSKLSLSLIRGQWVHKLWGRVTNTEDVELAVGLHLLEPMMLYCSYETSNAWLGIPRPPPRHPLHGSCSTLVLLVLAFRPGIQLLSQQ